MKGVLKFFDGILCKKEVLGKNYECKIAGINATIHFPQYPQVDDSNPKIGMSNPLLAPETGILFNNHDEPSFWGEPLSHPDGNSCVKRLVICIESDKSQTEEFASKLYEAYEDWAYSFAVHLMLETKQNLDRNRNKSEVAFLQLYDDKYIPNKTPINLYLNFPKDFTFASEEQVKNAIIFADSCKELSLEYQMLFSAYIAIQQNENRRAIMDACSALEITLVNQINQYCQSKGILPEIMTAKYRSLGERIDLIRYLDTSFPNKKYENLVVAPRNSLMHNKCIYPSEETTNNLISCVEEVLKYYHTSYY